MRIRPDKASQGEVYISDRERLSYALRILFVQEGSTAVRILKLLTYLALQVFFEIFLNSLLMLRVVLE